VRSIRNITLEDIKPILKKLDFEALCEVSSYCESLKKERKRPARPLNESHQSTANKRKSGAEQYYTNPDVVDKCIEQVKKHLSLDDKIILEPCGGTGEFIKGLLRAGIDKEKIISYDIHPKHDLVQQGNYLEIAESLSPSSSMISITNPPFGRASQLAKQFFNKSAEHCEYICYIVPKSWRKWSTHKSLDDRFHLIADIDLPKDCFYVPDGTLDKYGNVANKKKKTLNTIFQIWQKKEEKRKKVIIPDHGLIRKVTPENLNEERVVKGANFSIVYAGHSTGKCEDIVDDVVPYKTTTSYLKIDRQDVKDALRKIDWKKHYENTSYVRSLSINEINYELNDHFGLKNYQF